MGEGAGDGAVRFATDKLGQGYLPAYLRLAADIGAAGRVLEVGVWHGDGLDMFQALFPGGVVAGVDVDPTARWPEGTHKIVTSQDNPGLPAHLAPISREWDLVVDDASHDGDVSAVTFGLLWPLVAPGGWYVLEDWYVGMAHVPPWNGLYGPSMLVLAQSFLRMLDTIDGPLESVTYQYGMAILHKRAAA